MKIGEKFQYMLIGSSEEVNRTGDIMFEEEMAMNFQYLKKDINPQI